MKETDLLFPKGIKRTRQRESVLRALEKASSPLTASDICVLMEQNGDSAWLSTVYRTLDLLVSHGVVLKSSVFNTETAVYELSRNQHRHYAVCVACHRMIPIQNCPLDSFSPCLGGEEFYVTGHNMQLFGYCKDCIPRSYPCRR